MPISKALQTPGSDLLEAFKEIKNLEELVQNYRQDVDSYFGQIYKQILKIAEKNSRIDLMYRQKMHNNIIK